jgi:hypothetical protein
VRTDLSIARIPLALVALVAACAPQIGDPCSNASHCSINGDRLCDTSQPNGACIVFDCQPDRCPDDAVCVRFYPNPPRRAVVACMRRCSGDRDCRTGDGYVCRGVTELASEGLEVEIVDRERPDARFCIASTRDG